MAERPESLTDVCLSKCLLSNVRSLASSNRIDFVINFLIAENFKLAFFTETFLSSERIPTSFFSYSNFKVIRFDRCDSGRTSGGGVLMLLHEKFNYREIDTNMGQYYSLHKCELLAVDVDFANRLRYRFILVYRPPSTSCHQTKFLCEHLHSLLAPSNNILLGDFNCPGIDWQTFRSSSNSSNQTFFDFCNEHNLNQLVGFPTRIANSGAENILDLLLVDNMAITDVSPLPPLLNSDHSTVQFTLLSSKCDVKENDPPNTLDYKKADFARINQYLVSFDWRKEFELRATLQDKYDFLVNTINNAISAFCPVRARSKQNDKKDIVVKNCCVNRNGTDVISIQVTMPKLSIRL